VYCTPFNRVIALDPATGEQRWSFDPQIDRRGDRPFRCRGVSYAEESRTAAGAACRHRLYMSTHDRRLWAIDASSGKPCTGFGEGGSVRLYGPAGLVPGDVSNSSAPTVADGVVITGSTVIDFARASTPRGTVLAFASFDGKPLWQFDPRDAWGLTTWDRADCARQLASLHNLGLFTPTGEQLTLMFPGSLGGPNWGGGAMLGESGMLLVNLNNVAFTGQLIPNAEQPEPAGQQQDHPAAGHRMRVAMQGTPYAVEIGSLQSPLGIPCNPPPWGKLVAVDLTQGVIAWETALGSVHEMAPMRQEITSLGARELRHAQDVDQFLTESGAGTAMIVVNSVCGCAAGKARPGIAMALQHARRPDRVTTVFAGADLEATDHARALFTPYPPSSPSIGLLRDGKLVFMMERRDIENRDAASIAAALTAAFDTHCTELTPAP
jgi:putative YphP/YqiW family bacilliredoxin